MANASYYADSHTKTTGLSVIWKVQTLLREICKDRFFEAEFKLLGDREMTQRQACLTIRQTLNIDRTVQQEKFVTEVKNVWLLL